MAAISPFLLQFSHLNPHFLSHTVRLSLRPHFSPPRAAPPDSSASSGDSSPTPSSERDTNSRGSSSLNELNYNGKNKEKKKKRREKTVIRRDPIQIGVRTAREETTKEKEETSATEGAFLLGWLGLGALIFVEGVALAASGFLPEEWDGFLVKFLYPSFTPTVFLFLGLSVGYGVIKYFEAEKMKKN